MPETDICESQGCEERAAESQQIMARNVRGAKVANSLVRPENFPVGDYGKIWRITSLLAGNNTHNYENAG